jgi:hypothetical protein
MCDQILFGLTLNLEIVLFVWSGFLAMWKKGLIRYFNRKISYANF